jgi:hypothetical protein
MTYFHARAGHYHRRWHVSRSCSGWEGVVPRRYGRQTEEGPGSRGWKYLSRQSRGREEVEGRLHPAYCDQA